MEDLNNNTQEQLLKEIDQLKAKVAELEKSELKSSLWLENSPVCTKIVDLDFNLQYMSSSGVKDLKIKDISEFYGKPYPLHFYPDSFKIPMTKNLEKVKETGEIITQEAPIDNIDGKELWYHSTIVPVNNDKGELDYLMVVSLETTKRKQVEERLKDTFDISPSIISKANIDSGYFVEANAAVKKILGYSIEEFTSRPLMEFIHEDDRQRTIDEISEQLAGKEVASFENRYLCKDGSFKWMAWEGTAADKNGNITAIGSDINERKMAEIELQESHSLLTSIIESPNNVIMFALDTNYIYMSFNQAHVKEMKLIYDVDVEIGKSLVDYINNEEDRTQVIINYERALKGERFVEIQQYGTGKDRFWYELIFNPIFDDSNNVTGFAVYVTNITERKEAEEKLIESEQKFKTILQSMPLPLCYVNKEGVIIYRNERFIEVFGYNEEEVPSLTEWWQKAYPDKKYREWVLENWESALKEASENDTDIESEEYQVICKDGSKRDVIISGITIGDNFLATFIDITDKKKAEKDLRNALEINTNIVSSLVSGISIYNSTGQCILANDAMADTTGATTEQLLSQNYNTIESWKKSGLYAIALSAIKENKVKTKELNLRTTFGKEGNYRFNMIPTIIGGKAHLITMMEDLTDRELSRKRIDDILKGTNAGSWDWKILTGELELNERWAEIMGKTLKEFDPIDIKTWINNVHPDDFPKANNILNKVLNKELDYFDVVFRQPHKDGSLVWVNARGKVVDWSEDGKPLRMSGTHLDITKQMQAQEGLKKHQEELEETVKERTKELEVKNKKLDDAMKVFVGREQKIRDLEKRIRLMGGKIG